MTPCICEPEAGFCVRHGIWKTAHWKTLCQTRPDYFSAWEARRGPGQPVGQRPALPNEVIDARMAVCRRKCAHYRTEPPGRQWCDRDTRVLEDGSVCRVKAITNFPIRVIGKLPPCPKWSPLLSRSPRIGYLTPSIFVGGTEQWMLQIADYSGCTFQGTASPSTAWCQPAMVAALAKRMPIYGQTLVDCKRLVHDSDMILAWGQLEYERILTGFCGPVVFVSHNGDRKWTRTATEQAKESATHWVAVAEAAKIPAAGLVAPERFTVLYNGVERSHYGATISRAEARLRLSLEPTAVVVGYVGRYSLEKRWDLWTRGLEILPQRYEALYLGCGNDELELKAMAGNMLGDRAHFLPPRDQVGDVLAACDCLLQTSAGEGFGLAAVEAMAAGVPVVSTPVGILPELEAAHGLLWEPIPEDATPQQVAAAVRRVCEPADTAIATRTERARLVAQTRFSAERSATHWRGYLESVWLDWLLTLGVQPRASADDPPPVGRDMKSLMSAEERESLAVCATLAPSPGWIVELGTYEGASAAILCRAAGDQRVVTIDNYTSHRDGDHSSPDEVRQALGQLGYAPRVVVGQTDAVPPDIDTVAMLFIDSCHEGWAMDREMEAWGPRLAQDAIVVLHDYDRPIHTDLADAIDRRFGAGWQRLFVVDTLIAFRKTS
jgi:glycosyltransferase involved in cell wall biosynthesis